MTERAKVEAGGRRRLESWKAIAQHLGREVRSVQRWEQERGLPVHRVPGEKRGSVFAYADELDAWLNSGDNASPPADADAALAQETPASEAKRVSLFPWLLTGAVVALVLVLAATVGLRWWPRNADVTPASLPPRSLAVLPMINLSGDPGQDYFADGFTDELTTELAQIRSLRVISRTSTMLYKGSRKSLPGIARDLNVRYILEGSVARAANRVRVIAQLIDATTDVHVSAHTYNADVRNVLDIQGEIARAIADDVRLDLTPRERARLATTRVVDPEAHDLYLKASYLFAQQTPGSIAQSLALYKAAAAKAPSFALAYAGMAQAEYALMTITAQSESEGEAHVKEALARALSLDPHLADARGMLADLIYWRDWNWPEAERQYRLALADGAQSQTHRRFGADLITRGQFEQGMAHLQVALELDPLGMLPRMSQFLALYFQRRYGEGRHVLDEALSRNPDFLAGHALRGLDALLERDCPTATAEAVWVGRHFPSPLADFNSALASACRGDAVAARQSLGRMAAYKGPQYVTQYQLALGYAAIGDETSAMTFLEKSAASHEGQATYLNVDPLLEGLHSDPRFVALVRRLGLKP